MDAETHVNSKIPAYHLEQILSQHLWTPEAGLVTGEALERILSFSGNQSTGGAHRPRTLGI
jgi:hypothetical protein